MSEEVSYYSKKMRGSTAEALLSIDISGLREISQVKIVAMYIAVICIGIHDTMLELIITTSSNNKNYGTTSVPISRSEIYRCSPASLTSSDVMNTKCSSLK